MDFNHTLSYLHTDPLMQRVWNLGHKYIWKTPPYFHNVHLYRDCHTDIHLYLWIQRNQKCVINLGTTIFELRLEIYSNSAISMATICFPVYFDLDKSAATPI